MAAPACFSTAIKPRGPRTGKRGRNLTAGFPENDLTGYTFALPGAAVFFLLERNKVPKRWRVSLTAAGLIRLIAAVSYFYMQARYAGQGLSPTRFRYTDWLFTVPLMRTQFYGVAQEFKQTTRLRPGSISRNLLTF